MRTHLITVGDELLSGRTVNSNASFIGGTMGPVGAPVVEITAIGDNLDAIAAAIRRAVAEYDVVIVSGGLGPTHDDVTKSAIARALDIRLEMDRAAMEMIRARYARWGRKLSAAAESMALVPAGATLIENRWGTAPGFYLKLARAHVFAVPGVPREMQGMIPEGVVPIVRKLPGLTPVISRSVMTAGMPESKLADLLADLIPEPGSAITMAFLPGYAGVELRLTTTQNESALEELAKRIRERLGRVALGDADAVNLVSSVAQLLRERGETLASAESCTGGMLGKVLTDRPGSSAYYVGGVVAYSNEVKERLLGVAAELLAEHGAVSAEVAGAMAVGVRERLGSDYALAVTGIAGPGGGTETKPVGLIYLGLAHAGGVITREMRLSDDREQNRERSVYGALNLLRRFLIGDIDS